MIIKMDNVIWIHKILNLDSLTPKLFHVLFFHNAWILNWIFILKIQEMK